MPDGNSISWASEVTTAEALQESYNTDISGFIQAEHATSNNGNSVAWQAGTQLLPHKVVIQVNCPEYFKFAMLNLIFNIRWSLGC